MTLDWSSWHKENKTFKEIAQNALEYHCANGHCDKWGKIHTITSTGHQVHFFPNDFLRLFSIQNLNNVWQGLHCRVEKNCVQVFQFQAKKFLPGLILSNICSEKCFEVPCAFPPDNSEKTKGTGNENLEVKRRNENTQL